MERRRWRSASCASSIGAVALLLAMPLLGRSPGSLLRLWRTRAMLVTALAAAVYQPLFFGGVDRAGVALGTLLAVGAGPVFAGIVGWVVLRHRPTGGWLVATASASSASCCARPGSGLEELGPEAGIGLLMALGAGVCSALYTVGAKVQLEPRHAGPRDRDGQLRAGRCPAAAAAGGPAAGLGRDAVRHRARALPRCRDDGARERAADPGDPRLATRPDRDPDAHRPGGRHACSGSWCWARR